MTFKYYSTQRPIAPGTLPAEEGNPLKIENFGYRASVAEIKSVANYAYGYVEYDHHLPIKVARSYGLVCVADIAYLDMLDEILKSLESDYFNTEEQPESEEKCGKLKALDKAMELVGGLIDSMYDGV